MSLLKVCLYYVSNVGFLGLCMQNFDQCVETYLWGDQYVRLSYMSSTTELASQSILFSFFGPLE